VNVHFPDFNNHVMMIQTAVLADRVSTRASGIRSNLEFNNFISRLILCGTNCRTSIGFVTARRLNLAADVVVCGRALLPHKIEAKFHSHFRQRRSGGGEERSVGPRRDKTEDGRTRVAGASLAL